MKRKTQTGASMIEVLVSIMIVSFGMLAIASLQITTVNNNLGQLERSSAVLLTYSMMDRLRTDKAAAKAQKYNFAFDADVTVCDAPSTGSTKADNQTNKWLEEIKESLGDGSCGAIQCDSNGNCTIQVRWDNQLASGDPEPEVIQTESVL